MPKSSLNCWLINLARELITRAVEVNYHAHKTDDLAQCRRVLSRDMVGFSLILEDRNVGVALFVGCSDVVATGGRADIPGARPKRRFRPEAVIDTAGFAELKLSDVPTPLCSDFGW